MSDEKKDKRREGIEGILGGLSEFVGKLSELAEKGDELSKTGQFQWGAGKDQKGVFGFSVKTGLGDQDIKVEPFGNIHRDEKSGQPIVEENREPIVDVFEEEDHTLIVAEMPGISTADVHFEVKDDLLTIHAKKGNKRYQKEILLPRCYPKDKMQLSCNNGILEIKCIM
ncbi:MAG: Hsp20/alpha crystallin family protein [Candidatus Hatepunaea meridiana]|nr:Hsp20/alpha crystallin family protein [Candidatus Hatepunaea meridiana]